MSGYSWRVPLTVYGDLTIQGSAELGEAGARLGEPILFHWSIWWNVLALAPLGTLLLLLFMPGNLNGRAWVIIAPLVVCAGLPALIGTLVPDAARVTTVMTSMVMAMTALWLVSGWLARTRRLVAAPVALVILIVLGAAGSLAESGLVLDANLLGSLAAHAVWAGAFVTAMAIAAALCRKKYHPGRLVLAFSLCGLGIVLVACLVATAVGTVVYMREVEDSRLALAVVVGGTAGSVFATMLTGAFVWGPFLALAFANQVYRDRLHRILRLPGMQRQIPPPLPMR